MLDLTSGLVEKTKLFRLKRGVYQKKLVSLQFVFNRF